MQDIITFINTPSPRVEVILACFFSLAIALFYKFKIPTSYTNKLPRWFFFVLMPSIIIANKIIFDINAFAIIVFLFLLLMFLLFFAGIIDSISNTVKNIKKRAKTKKASPKLFSIIKVILIVLAGIAFMLFIPSMLPVYILFIIALLSFLKYIDKNSYLNLQANLPTSKIRSMTMGLVEVKGKVLILEPLQIGGKECVGYRHLIEVLETDSNGHRSYRTISDKIYCNDFEIEDDTAKVTVKAKDIDLKWLNEDNSESISGRKHTHYLLFEGDEVLIIANATSSENETYLHKKSEDSIFTLAPFDSVTLWNTNKPLINTLLFYCALFLIVLAFIMYLNISLIENTIVITIPSNFEPIDFNKISRFLFN